MRNFAAYHVRVNRALVRIVSLALALGACGGGGAPSPPEGESGAIRFPAADGVQLEGRLQNGGRREAVVFAHEFPASQESWGDFAEEVAGRGFATLTFNFRGYGLSGGSRDPSMAATDVGAAIAEISRRGAGTVFLAGASMGGAASIIAAGERGVAGVVALSAPQRFQGLDASGVSLRAPALLIAAAGDGDAPASARAFYERASGPRRIEIIPDTAAHGTALLADPGAGSRVRGLIADFLIENRG